MEHILMLLFFVRFTIENDKDFMYIKTHVHNVLARKDKYFST